MEEGIIRQNTRLPCHFFSESTKLNAAFREMLELSNGSVWVKDDFRFEGKFHDRGEDYALDKNVKLIMKGLSAAK